MKPGLRLQILLLLGALMVVGFVPLYFAVETYLQAALLQSRTKHAEALGLSVSNWMLEARRSRSPEEVGKLLSLGLGGSVRAIAVYDASGARKSVAGDDGALASLPTRVSTGKPERRVTAGRRFLVASVADASGSVSVALLDDEPKARVLTRLLGLYMALIAVLLLFAAYYTLTRWIVRPVARLSLAAQRVASTTRRFEPTETRSRELSELSQSLQVMTERLLAEEEALRNKVVEVELATERLKSAQAQLLRSERMASVGQLAAGLAHEVGNPIAAMMGMQDLILGGGLSAEEQTDFIGRMRKETQRIHRILRNLLDFARPLAPGDSPSDPASVEVAIHETTTLLMPQPVMRKVDVQLDVFPDLPNVRLRQEQLVQVLLNLLMNAAQACRSGGKVLVSARRAGDQVEIVVQDDGPGVPDDLADRIFEPFVSSKEVGEGSGLGLSVCRGLVEAVGGTISLDAGYRNGARFVLRLPVQAEPEG